MDFDNVVSRFNKLAKEIQDLRYSGRELTDRPIVKRSEEIWELRHVGLTLYDESIGARIGRMDDFLMFHTGSPASTTDLSHGDGTSYYLLQVKTRIDSSEMFSKKLHLLFHDYHCELIESEQIEGEGEDVGAYLYTFRLERTRSLRSIIMNAPLPYHE